MAKAGVPIFHIHGDADATVPLDRNSRALCDRYTALGGRMQLVVIEGKGHAEIPEFFESPALLEFLMKQGRKRDPG
jgi:predicted esterase